MDAIAVLPADGHAFSACYLAAFLAAWVVLFCEGRRRNWPTGPWLLLTAWTMLCAVAGSKLAMLTPGDWTAALGRGLLPTTSHKSFIGIVVGGFIGAHVGRRLLGFTAAIGDAFALALPVGLGVARVGCLLGGCCIGTPTSLPWAVCYPAGSLAHSVHVMRGLIPPDAPTSLAVHPVQTYETLLLVCMLGTLLWARPRLKRGLSLFLLYLVLQSVVRLGIESVREGRPMPHVLGLSPLQLALAALALGYAAALWIRERRRPEVAPATVRPRLGSVIGLATATAAALVVLTGWFTQVELLILVILTLPALVLAARSAAQTAGPALRRVATAALAVQITLIVAQTDGSSTKPEEPQGYDEQLRSHQAYYNVSGGGAFGGYELEHCGNVVDEYYYCEGGLNLSRTDDFGNAGRLEYGLGASADWVLDNNSASEQVYALGRAFASYDHRWFGLGFGGHVGNLDDDVEPWAGLTWLPIARLRLGPEDAFYVDASAWDQPSGIRPWLRTGIGFLSLRQHRVSVRLGVSSPIPDMFSTPLQFYAYPSFALGRGFVTSPFIGVGDAYNFHVGLGLKYSFGHNWGRK